MQSVISIHFFSIQTKVWQSDTNWAKFRHINNNAFKKSQEDQALVVHIIWGLKEQDRSECHHSDFKCKGKTVFDRSFDLNPPPCQTAMLVSCFIWKEIERNFHNINRGIKQQIKCMKVCKVKFGYAQQFRETKKKICDSKQKLFKLKCM